MTICTIDVHARDVVAKMITAKARALGAGEATGVGTLAPDWPLPWGGDCVPGSVLPSPLPETHPCTAGGPEPPGSGMGLETSCFQRASRRWRAHRPSPGSPSSGIAGMRRRGTASPTSATPRSSTPTSTWVTRHGWSSPRSPTGEDARPPSLRDSGSKSVFSVGSSPQFLLLGLKELGLWVRGTWVRVSPAICHVLWAPCANPRIGH